MAFSTMALRGSLLCRLLFPCFTIILGMYIVNRIVLYHLKYVWALIAPIRNVDVEGVDKPVLNLCKYLPLMLSKSWDSNIHVR